MTDEATPKAPSKQPGREAFLVGGKLRNVYLSEPDKNALRQIGDNNVSAGIRIVLNEYRSKRTDWGKTDAVS